MIVPVYNTEKYLRGCIESVIFKRNANIELILVDDGSTDSSGKICDEYAAKDYRVKVFHKTNGGVSSARNLGIDSAEGEWVYFLDSDDELFLDRIEALVEDCTKENVIDFITAGYELYELNGGQYATSSSREFQTIDINQAIELMYQDSFYQFYTSSKLFKQSILEMYNLRFDETLYFSEDRLFIVQYLCKTTNYIGYTKYPIFKYVIRKSGAMKSLESSFNYKSITGFYAAVKMFHVLKADFRVTKKNKSIAINDVIYSYNITRARMVEYGIQDKLIVKVMNANLATVLSATQYVIVLLKFYFKRLGKAILYHGRI